MSKYRVYLTAVASTSIEVEAEDGDSAVDIALGSSNLPFAPAFAGFDLSEWSTNSDLFRGKPEDDYEEVDA